MAAQFRTALKSRRGESDRGDTLIELLIATVIISVTVAALLGALIGATSSSVEHRSLATLDSVLKSFVESAKYDIQQQSGSGAFTDCAKSYTVLGSPSPSSGPLGSSVTVLGTGYTPDAPLSVQIDSTPVSPLYVTAGATSDSAGDVSLTFMVPPGTPAGPHQIRVTDGSHSSTATGDYTVNTDQPVPSAIAGYRIQTTDIEWWNKLTSSFDSSTGVCAPGDHSGVQQITYTAVAPDNSSDRLSFVAYNPANLGPSIMGATATTFTANQPGRIVISTTGYPIPELSDAAFTADGGCDPSDLPSGVSFTDNGDGTATLAGTPATGTGGVYTVCVSAVNAMGAADEPFILTVDAPPTFSSPASTTFTVGTHGDFTVTATGWPLPTLSRCGPDVLPSGLTLTINSDGTATVAGTPGASSGGSYTVCLTASNSLGTVSQNLKVLVYQAPSFTGPSAATFPSQSPFNTSVSGYPTPTITAANLPPGISFSGGTLSESGSPAGGIYDIDLIASNAAGTTTEPFTLVIDQRPGFVRPGPAETITWTQNEPGTYTPVATGYPKPTVIATGLPPGVSFTGGSLTGAPTTASGSPFTVTFTATNSLGSTQQTLQIAVSSMNPDITSASTTTFTEGTSGSFDIALPKHASASVVTGMGTLPPGISLSTSGGQYQIAGTPAAGTGGIYPVVIQSKKSGNTSYQPFTLIVDAAPAISSPNALTWTAQSAGTFTPLTAGYPQPSITESGPLPPGLSFAFGTLTGTPTAAGSYSVTLTASNGVAPDSRQTVTINVDQPPVVTSSPSTVLTVGTPATFTATAAGLPAPTLSEAGVLPNGVNFAGNSLSGTPADGSQGIYDIVITATSSAFTTTQPFTLEVKP